MRCLMDEVVRSDAATQTIAESPPSVEKTPISRRRPMAPRLLQGTLWRGGHLPACASALAIREDDSTSNRCLRKLEMRIAPCWRGDSLRDSEHSSLQVSSTQSPSTEEYERHSDENRRTPPSFSSFSSLSSPLDHSSVLKD